MNAFSNSWIFQPLSCYGKIISFCCLRTYIDSILTVAPRKQNYLSINVYNTKDDVYQRYRVAMTLCFNIKTLYNKIAINPCNKFSPPVYFTQV